MRLIDLQTSSLKDFSGSSKPPYAILSHRWGKHEITYEDVCTQTITTKDLSPKLRGMVRQARGDKLQYIWVDTCCIDKKSSAELSEAINSMYEWYKHAQRCYVYLYDVDKKRGMKSFCRSKWFTRGWTLQELLAASNVAFYDRFWKFLGNKKTLALEISRVTKIDIEALLTGNVHKYSVAQKMSWAAKRTTTRVEDMAYCLLGLFNVNMPLLYGEGERAFLRLQEEIIKDDDDQSIFAWSMGNIKGSGLLAPSVAAFVGCESTVSQPSPSGRSPFFITNRGLTINLQITPWSVDTYLAYLECSRPVKAWGHFPNVNAGVFLRRLTENDQYARINLGGQDLFFDTERIHDQDTRPLQMRQLFVRRDVREEQETSCLKNHVYGFRVPQRCFPRSEMHIDQARFHKGCAILLPSGWGQTVVIDSSAEPWGIKQITLGFDFDFNPVCILETGSEYADARSKHGEMNAPLKRHRLSDWTYNFPNDFDWCEIYEGSKVRPRPDQNGIWALRGHRLYGLDGFMPESQSHGGLWVALYRDEERASSAWELYVGDMADSRTGNGHKHFERSFVNRRNFQNSYGLKMTPEDIQEGNSILQVLYQRSDGPRKICL